MGWNLPPGVSENDIPGNRPEDQAFDVFMDTEDCREFDRVWGRKLERKLINNAKYEEELEKAFRQWYDKQCEPLFDIED